MGAFLLTNGKALLVENLDFSLRFINLRGVLMFRLDAFQELSIIVTNKGQSLVAS